MRCANICDAIVVRPVIAIIIVIGRRGVSVIGDMPEITLTDEEARVAVEFMRDCLSLREAGMSEREILDLRALPSDISARVLVLLQRVGLHSP